MVELDELAIAFIKSRNEAYIKHCAAPVGAFRADVYHDTRADIEQLLDQERKRL